jgi:hypothetical protein
VADQRKPQLTALNATAAHTNSAAAGNTKREDVLNRELNEVR